MSHCDHCNARLGETHGAGCPDGPTEPQARMARIEAAYYAVRELHKPVLAEDEAKRPTSPPYCAAPDCSSLRRGLTGWPCATARLVYTVEEITRLDAEPRKATT